MLARFLLTLLAVISPLVAAPFEVRDFAAKAESRQPVSVVFFGGSLTFGANASDPNVTSYRGRMMEWLRARYPNTPIDFHDAAIGGTGSQLGMFRLERDVLRHKPDLVFLDFTVNDGSDETDPQTLASYEAIVRTLMRNNVAVMPVIMLFKWHSPKPGVMPARHAEHMKLANIYGIPLADVCSYVQNRVATGVDPDGLWNLGDGAHPGDEGYALFFEAVRRRFEIAAVASPSAVIPEKTVFPDLYPERRRTTLSGHLPAGWEMRKTWRTALWFDGMASRWMDDVATASAKEKSGPLEMEFEGSTVGIFGERNGLTPPVRIWIDGKAIPSPHAKDGDLVWRLDTSRFAPPHKGSGNLFLWQSISRNLADGKHQLRIEPVWDHAHPDAELRIESICSAGR